MTTFTSRVLVTSCDEAYSRGLFVALASIMRQLPAGFEVDVVIYDDGLSQRSRAELTRIVSRAPSISRLHLKPGFSQSGDLPVARHVNQSMYSRLLIPELSRTVERALQFDADTLCVDDISELLTMDLGDSTFAACVDKDTPTVETGVPYSYQTLGLPPTRPYFNAGVLVINVEAWRREDVSGRTMDYVRRWSDDLRCPDQEGINAVSGEEGLVIDRRFNFQVSGEGLAAAASHDSSDGLRELKRVAMVHFTGPKPWLNVWFSSILWIRPTIRWWGIALGSSLISPRTRVDLLRTGVATFARELRRLGSRG